jgi:hypothetical protein
VSIAPDFGAYILLTDIRIVGRHATVVMETIDGAVVVRDILCGVGLQVSPGSHLTFSHRHEEVPIGIEREPPTVVARTTPGLGYKDVFDIREPVILEAPPRDRRGRPCAIAYRLGITQVDQSIRLEVRMKDYVEESTLALDQNLRDPLDGRHAQDPVSDETKPARLLRDQYVASGKERYGPGADQAVGYRDDPIVVVCRAEDRRLAQNGRSDGQKKPYGDEYSCGCPNHLNLLGSLRPKSRAVPTER